MRFAVAALTVAGGTGAVVLTLAALTAPPPGHRLLHINCPPGSHGGIAKSDIARKLEVARTQSVGARSLTAGHPALTQPNAPKW